MCSGPERAGGTKARLVGHQVSQHGDGDSKAKRGRLRASDSTGEEDGMSLGSSEMAGKTGTTYSLPRVDWCTSTQVLRIHSQIAWAFLPAGWTSTRPTRSDGGYSCSHGANREPQVPSDPMQSSRGGPCRRIGLAGASYLSHPGPAGSCAQVQTQSTSAAITYSVEASLHRMVLEVRQVLLWMILRRMSDSHLVTRYLIWTSLALPTPHSYRNQTWLRGGSLSLLVFAHLT